MIRSLKMFFLILVLPLFAVSQENIKFLREYIELGLKNNLELQSAKANLRTYDEKVNQSISNFLPKIDIIGRYTRAGGGRSFEFPLGTMLNPIYEFMGSPFRFENIKESFVRPEEQDTKVELVQPIFNMAILQNYNVQSDLYESAANEYKAREINLIFSIKESYYNYIKSLQLVDVRKSALKLAQENYDVITKMFKVEKAPKTDVLRADVLLSETQQELQNAINQTTLAKNFFNTLLNRDFNTIINVDTISIEDLQKDNIIQNLQPKIPLEQAMEFALNSKPELHQLEHAIKAAESGKKIMASDYFPTVSLVADYGFQDIKYNFKKDANYWMVTGAFSWNLFSGLGTNSKVNEAEAQVNSLMKSYENVKQLTRLDIKNNFIDLQSNIDQITLAKKRYNSADENFNMIRKRYEEGLAPFINLIDAQTTLDAAKANFVVVYNSTLISKAKLEKSMGAFYIDR